MTISYPNTTRIRLFYSGPRLGIQIDNEITFYNPENLSVYSQSTGKIYMSDNSSGEDVVILEAFAQSFIDFNDSSINNVVDSINQFLVTVLVPSLSLPEVAAIKNATPPATGSNYFLTLLNAVASFIGFTPNGDITSTNVQDAIVEVRDDVDSKLSLKQDISEKGIANGYAELDGSGLVPLSQLPSDITDLSTHSVTELNDVVSAGSGNIITNQERTDLLTTDQKSGVVNAPNAINGANPVADKQYVDGLVDGTLKTPEAYDPAGSGNFPTTYGGNPIEKGDSFRILTADTLGSGTIVNPEDLLISDVDTPGQTDSNWQVIESNRDQATETVKGVALVATLAKVDAQTDDEAFVTSLKLGQSQLQTDVTANNSKVSADGSIDTHSDVDTTNETKVANQTLLRWNGSDEWESWRPFYASKKATDTDYTGQTTVGLINQTTTLEEYNRHEFTPRDTDNYNIRGSYVSSYNANNSSIEIIVELREVVGDVLIGTISTEIQEPKESGGGGLVLNTVSGGVIGGNTNSGTNQRRPGAYNEDFLLTGGTSYYVVILFRGLVGNNEAALYKASNSVEQKTITL